MNIDTYEVTQNETGLFLMRDLFRASDAPDHKSPTVFFRQNSTNEIIELMGGDCINKVRGSKGGVYACKEVVIAYAMWISPEFYLKVLRTFSKVAEGDLHGAAMEANTDASRAAAMRLSMSYVESDRLMFRDKEKAIELLKSANMSEETFKDRTKNNIKVEMTTFLSKKRKSSDLITEVTRIAAFKHGVTDSNLIFECYNDMLDDGVIRSDGVYVTIV